MPDIGNIIIRGAKENNLKNIDVSIPRGKFVVITGLSGSGKSSLAFDTLFAEGQRRFAESLSSYARQFLGRMSKPDVKSIEGIPPAIAIEQKVNVKNPRSTVATTTEIYDYLRLIFARVGHTYSPISGREVHCDTASDVVAYISKLETDTIYILADLQWSERKDKVEKLLSLSEQGFSRLYADGVVRISDLIKNAETGDFPEEVYLLVDRVRLPKQEEWEEAYSKQDKSDFMMRLHSSISSAFTTGKGDIYIMDASRVQKAEVDKEASQQSKIKKFSNKFELDGIKFRQPDEYLFSFNSPLGACPVCGGLGKIIGVSEDMVIPDKTMSIYDGAIACWRGEKMSYFKNKVIQNSQKYNIPIFKPYCNLPEEIKDLLWDGVKGETDEETIIGLNEFFEWIEAKKYKIQFRFMLNRFSGRTVCHSCKGSRLRKEAMYVKIAGKNIHQLMSMNIDQLLDFFKNMEISEYDRSVITKALDEIVSRLTYIKQVGLSYLTLNRPCNTLSGGETQRINLVTALGSSLVGSLYILDEPSVGLHSRDTDRLITVLKQLRDAGNTVVVVEHDEEIMRAADMLIDMGPGAGETGGNIVFQGCIEDYLKNPDTDLKYKPSDSLTLKYLNKDIKRFERKKHSWSEFIEVQGAMEHNLKDINVKFPLGVLTAVTGVSGSGKSSLVGDILHPALFRHINQRGDLPGVFKQLSGNLDSIQRIEYVDQNPIGRSSRSNAVTYLKIYDDIRKLFSEQQYAKINGYTPSYFSFNQDGGRCTECQGEGFVKIEMQFMADVKMVCEACGGKRFKQDILEVRYKDKNIDDILNMSVTEAIRFFSSQKEPLAQSIARQMKPLVDVGLSYIKLGQSSSSFSGGESQRVKLAFFLSMSETTGRHRDDKIMFIFDEPTTGLHFNDVELLLKAFDILIDKGHTIVVVEHNPDVIRASDWVIDLGPDAGDNGGKVVFEGTPEELIKTSNTYTAQYLKI